MYSHTEQLQKKLEELRLQDKFRQLPGDRAGIDFWSNDYLGFAKSLEQELSSGYAMLGGGATGSRLISGDRAAYQAIEARIATYHQAEAALVFTNGYMANVGLLAAVPQRGDTVLYDQLIHASLRDGIRLGLAQAFSFRHNDLEHLKDRLAVAKGKVFVVTESVFSMDGDYAPLRELLPICEQYAAALIVDEAHSIGVDGVRGEGLVAAVGLQDRVFARILTYGKAMGCHGAAVLGSRILIDYLINHARSFIFSTGPSPHQWASMSAAYDRLIELGQPRRQLLLQRIATYKAAVSEYLPASWLAKPPGDHAIQWIACSGNSRVLELEQGLLSAGFLVKAIRHPTVAQGAERIRLCLHTYNTAEEIRHLLNCVAAIQAERPIKSQ